MPKFPLRPLWQPALLVAGLWGLAGCASAPVVEAPRENAAAHLVLENLTARTWDISLTPVRGGPVRVERIAPQATKNLVVEAGDFSVVQTLLDTGGRGEVVRRLEVSLKSGKRYRWPLATLSEGRTIEPAKVPARP